MKLFATTPKGMEPLLVAELTALGAARVRPGRAGAAFDGSLETAYRVCLWSRLASRVLLNLIQIPAEDAETLYRGVRAFPWEEHLGVDDTLAVDFMGGNDAIRHTGFGAQKVKDGVVDRMRERHGGARPGVDLRDPGLRLNVRLAGERATLSLDLSGESLHRRGYRLEAGPAPLKENLAAAILLFLEWPAVAAAGGALLDPLCGSGTLVLEGALMAGDVAPGLLRERFGFSRWPQHDPSLWAQLLAEAEQRRQAGRERLPPLLGWDRDGRVLEVAQENARRAGMAERVTWVQGEVSQVRPPLGTPPGLVVANPPYGQRMQPGDAELAALYRTLGATLREGFHGWRWGVFCAEGELPAALGLPLGEGTPLFNGPIPCRVWGWRGGKPCAATAHPPREKSQRAQRTRSDSAATAPRAGAQRPSPPVDMEQLPPVTPHPHPGPGAEMFANRLRKNLKRLGRWLRKEGVTCYRVYDADMPEYAVAVDRYGGWVHVQEYQAPAGIDPHKARERLAEVLAMVPRVLEVPPERVVLKVRQRQKGSRQYRKLGEGGALIPVTEGGLKFLVNLTDYLDTGLFLDHRPLRGMIREEAGGKRFLNLFGYTGSATVHAAAGGALATTTVDLSATYLEWAGRNLSLNGFTGAEHRLVQADCLEWLDAAAGEEPPYQLILLDPPTFSNSKRMRDTLDLQRDHAGLIALAARLLAPGGVLYFSNNYSRFQLDLEALPRFLQVTGITRETIPPDFQRGHPPHQVWRMVRRG